ncbi:MULTISPECIES: 50S ribosomal protein L11 methyltransferase [Desulfobacula]|uniref:Ribosomal protein L11 methyltransferase n=2 Tax=Desulfobacula TaxID=28222 RepID=K0NN23_DESTT|nr:MULTISPECIES: 50S ribosomal protein L11 methyltransferase [Desulfobacula]CCK82015.1 PrmA2: ribosomal protein L11 methyltransferase [Desulfobacula toluolica Tol2]SDU43805.1 ribosomal protein L11 methyltransferase [Desulfobacula phenolica]
MKFKKVIVQFDTKDLMLAEELICDIFFSFSLKGVVCDIPLDEPDEGFGTNTLPKPEINSITGFLPLIDSSDIILEKIKQQAAKLSSLDIKTNIKTQIVDEKDWADAWKDYFEVTKVTDKITIKPEWKDHTAQENEIVIHLDPGMAFGTGTHPTTAMCIKQIETFLVPGSTFLDVGTGSGILMVAAAKLGASCLVGIDTDEVAINVAKKNLAKNDIDPEIFDLLCTPIDTMPQDQKPAQTFGFIAANIIAQVIVDILPQISLRMTHKTTTVLSGIIKERQADVMKALEASHLVVIHEDHMDEWVTLAVKKTP